MKNFCIFHIFLVILLLLAYEFTQAQDLFISVRGDTVKGEVKQLSFGPEKKVQVITPDKKKTTFSIFQTRLYIDKGETYLPVKGPKGYVFMKLKKPGYLSLLGFQPENQTTYDGLFLLKKDGSGMEVPGLTFKKMMQRFLSDCPDVTARIDNGDLSRRDIELIVDEYNGCIEGKTAEHDKITARIRQQTKKISAWDVLEEKVKGKDFERKQDALEMITDIKGKIQRNEKIPNFLLEGLKNSLSQTDLSAELDSALAEIKQ